jgi:hypothetical protein
MKIISLLAAALLLTGLNLPAQSLPVPRGTSLTLNTSTNQVALPGRNPTTITVSVILRNHSRAPLSFAFDSLDSAQARFQFHLFAANSDTPIFSTLGTSPKRLRPATATSQSLPGLSAWTATAIIPTFLNGAYLPPGSYRIEAVLLADPTVSASTFLKVESSQVRFPTPSPKPSNGALVSKIDALSANLATAANGDRVIRVEAEATVPHPGYTRNPRLVPASIAPAIAALDGSILFLRFEVDPPDPRFMYPMILAKVRTSAEFPYTNETMVWVYAADSHEIAQISRP